MTSICSLQEEKLPGTQLLSDRKYQYQKIIYQIYFVYLLEQTVNKIHHLFYYMSLLIN